MGKKLVKQSNNSVIRIIKNFSQLLFSMVVTTLGTFCCYTILGRKMNIEEYGLFSSILALVTMISVFVNNIAAGIVANREIAINPAVSIHILKKFFWIRLFAFFIAAFYLYYEISFHYQSSIVLYCSALLLLVQDIFWELFEQIAFGLKITIISMVLNILFILSWLIVVLITPENKSTLVCVSLCYSLICFIRTIVYGVWIFYIANKYSGKNNTISLKNLIFYSMPYLYNRILGTFTTQLPVLLLKGYTDLSETAYYSMGEKFTTPITKLTTVAISALFPFVAKKLKEDHEIAAKYISDFILFVISFGACLAVLLTSTSHIWIVSLLGKKYINATESFNYQVWFTIIVSVDCIISMILSCDYKQKILSIITSIDVLIVLFFIWRGMSEGAKGVALAKLFASVICMLYHLLIIAKLYGNKTITLRLVFSWLLFICLLLMTLLINSIYIRLLISIIALIICICINKESIYLFYFQLRAKTRKE